MLVTLRRIRTFLHVFLVLVGWFWKSFIPNHRNPEPLRPYIEGDLRVQVMKELHRTILHCSVDRFLQGAALDVKYAVRAN